MNWAKLLVLLPLAYIMWWFYSLFTWILPSLFTPVSYIANVTWWDIISVILFSTVGVFLLAVCLILFFLIIFD